MAIIRAFHLSIWVAVLWITAGAQASEPFVETGDLIVADAQGTLSKDTLKRLAQQGQEMLNSVVLFWSTDPGTHPFGKIRLIFDAPRRDVYSSVFYWDKKDGQKIRVVRVFGTDGLPHMMAHKLTSAVLPNKDKLIRNMMGILTEVHVGNPLTFPMCGFSSDDWVLAFLSMKSVIPLSKLGPDQESWGMKDGGGGRLMILDKPKQHKAYAEAGSFGTYLFSTYGINKIKEFHRISHQKERPWQEVFGKGLEELEAHWIQTLGANAEREAGNVSLILKMLETNPDEACGAAQSFQRTGTVTTTPQGETRPSQLQRGSGGGPGSGKGSKER